MLATFIDTLTNPFAIAFLATGLIGSVLIAAWPSLRKFADNPSYHLRALPRHALTVARDPAPGARAAAPSQKLPRAVFVFGAIGTVLAAWSAYAFARPTQDVHTARGTQFENVSSFAFTGHGPASNALPDGTVGPISAESFVQGKTPVLYSNVLTSLDFAFNYQMQSKQPLQVLGTGGTALRIKAQDGWERTITLQPPQQLIGPNVTLWFTLNLDAARLVIAAVERETGSHSDWYDFSVVPIVRLAGQQGTRHIDETYAPEYRLRYDRVHITPDATMERTEPKQGPVQVESSRHVVFFGLSIPYALARWLAGAAAIAAMARAVMLVPSKPAPVRNAPLPKSKAAAPPPVSMHADPPPKESPAASPPPPAVDSPPSPETLRAAIARNLAASAEMAALLADSVKASSNGPGHRNNSQSDNGDSSSAGESPAA